MNNAQEEIQKLKVELANGAKFPNDIRRKIAKLKGEIELAEAVAFFDELAKGLPQRHVLISPDCRVFTPGVWR